MSMKPVTISLSEKFSFWLDDGVITQPHKNDTSYFLIRHPSEKQYTEIVQWLTATFGARAKRKKLNEVWQIYLFSDFKGCIGYDFKTKKIMITGEDASDESGLEADLSVAFRVRDPASMSFKLRFSEYFEELG